MEPGWTAVGALCEGRFSRGEQEVSFGDGQSQRPVRHLCVGVKEGWGVQRHGLLHYKKQEVWNKQGHRPGPCA